MRQTMTVVAFALAAGTLSSAFGDVDVGGESVEVVDAHLHTGAWAQQPQSAKEFIVSVQPAQFQLYAPALVDALTAPYRAHVGIRAQTEWAGVGRAVIYATYTHHTHGYMSNMALRDMLVDDRNDGWAWGFASINLDDISDAEIRASRVSALASYFEHHPDLFIGIKLAHAHQAVVFDDEVMNDVYQVAADYGVPVLLHTGFSPFPGSHAEPEYYDPIYLRSIVEQFDGQDGRPRVDFILSHVGQGDGRATANALDLAVEFANVWLEVSALTGPQSIDAEGNPSDSTEPQFQSVLARILERGLVGRTLFGTDGPQFSGKVRQYTQDIADEMLVAGYSIEQIRAVMAGNFHALFATGD